MDGSLPVEVLDTLLHHPLADEQFRGYVAAGPVEDALVYQVAGYGADIAALCARDAVWAEAVARVWVDDREWAQLPAELQRRIRIVSDARPEHPAGIGRNKAGGRQGRGQRPG